MRQIAMIGTAPSTRSQAPFKATDWEIWGQADYWKDMEKITRWYEFAPISKLRAEFPAYMEFLRSADFPIYMRAKFADIPKSEAFPFEEMATKFGKEFMTATLVWMMCHAITEHMNGDTVKVIGLWGYDMALDGEYVHQRPGIRHMEWVCREHLPALGFDPILVMIPKGSDLRLTPIPYPFAEDDEMVAKIRSRRNDIRNRLAGAKHQLAQHEQGVRNGREAIKYLEGALENLEYFERMACGTKFPAA